MCLQHHYALRGSPPQAANRSPTQVWVQGLQARSPHRSRAARSLALGAAQSWPQQAHMSSKPAHPTHVTRAAWRWGPPGCARPASCRMPARRSAGRRSQKHERFEVWRAWPRRQLHAVPQRAALQGGHKARLPRAKHSAGVCSSGWPTPQPPPSSGNLQLAHPQRPSHPTHPP